MYNYFISAFTLFLCVAAQQSIYAADDAKSPLETAQDALTVLKKEYKKDRRNFRKNGGDAMFLTEENKDTLKVSAPKEWVVGMSADTPGLPDSIYTINRLRRMLRYGSYADKITDAVINVRLAKSQKQGEYLTSKDYFKILKDAGFIDRSENWQDHFAKDPQSQNPKTINALKLLPTLCAIRSLMNQIISDTPLNLSAAKFTGPEYTYNQLQSMLLDAKKATFRTDLLDGTLFQFIKQYDPQTPYFTNIVKTGMKGASFFDDRQGTQPTLGDAQVFLKRSQIKDSTGKLTNTVIKTIADVSSLGDAIAYLTGGRPELDDQADSETDSGAESTTDSGE